MRRSSCLLVALLLLGGLLLGLDRASVAVVERLAGSRAEAEGVEGARVDVRGFPVLTQLVRFEADDVDVSADALTRGGVRVEGLTADLDGVRLATLSRVEVSRVSGRGTVPFSEVEARAGLERGAVSAAGDRSVRVRQAVDLLGAAVQAVVTAEVVLEDAQVTLAPRELELDGRPAPELLERLRDRLGTRVPLPALPAGLEVTQVHVVAGGVQVDVGGTDVVLERGSP